MIGLLLALAAGVGLLVPGVYRNNTAFAAAAFRGTDLVSLVVALPTLAGSLWLARRGSRRGLLVWLGVLAYVAYTYLYTFAIAWNRLFLVYVALLSLSLFTLMRALVALDPEELAGRFSDRTRVRGVSTFLWVVGGLLGLMELAQVVPALLAGEVPATVVQTGHPTGVIYIVDLGLVVPLMLLAGRWVRARHPFGYVAAAILLVKGVTVGLGLLASNLLGYLDNGRTDGPLLALWALIAVGSLLVLGRYLHSMHDQPVGRPTRLAREPAANRPSTRKKPRDRMTGPLPAIPDCPPGRSGGQPGGTKEATERTELCGRTTTRPHLHGDSERRGSHGPHRR